MSLSFAWGFTPKLEEPKKEHQHQHQRKAVQQQPETQKHKRRYTEDEETTPRRTVKRDKFRVAKKEVQQHKKTRAATQRILGQPLPTLRVVEVMDKPQLEALVNQLVSLHPELALDINACAQRPSVSSCIVILTQKVEAITAALPYRVDQGSEYAYLRVKPLIEDFLSALSDYTLGFLPPVQTQCTVSLDFLHQATLLLHKLPSFTRLSNNYFRDIAYEQLAHTWCMCLRELISASSAMLGLVGNWEAVVKQHNELSDGKLTAVVELFREEAEDESPAKMGMHNFSAHNSPCGVKGLLLEHQ